MIIFQGSVKKKPKKKNRISVWEWASLVAFWYNSKRWKMGIKIALALKLQDLGLNHGSEFSLWNRSPYYNLYKLQAPPLYNGNNRTHSVYLSGMMQRSDARMQDQEIK